jgi:integration host factor subunit beta
MTKSDLIEKLVETHYSMTRQDVELSVKTILNAISSALSSGRRVEIRRFGSFRLNYRPSRVGRNPKNGNAVDIPSKWTPYFRAGVELRRRVDQ